MLSLSSRTYRYDAISIQALHRDSNLQIRFARMFNKTPSHWIWICTRFSTLTGRHLIRMKIMRCVASA